jgi:hypothetical protein
MGEPDNEIAAISLVYEALKNLEQQAQARVLDYVSRKLNIRVELNTDQFRGGEEAAERVVTGDRESQVKRTAHPGEDQLEGISPVAQKWIRRNALKVSQLSSIFSLGVDEIDLVAKSVPGKSKRARLHSVLLLRGVAAYLSGGVARMTHEEVKETSLHYDAYDSPNFAKHIKAFGADVAGSKESSYTLTARGLTAATDLVKQMTAPKPN